MRCSSVAQGRLSLLGERLAAVGMAVFEDGHEIRVLPAARVVLALAALTTLEVQLQLTEEAVEVLVIVGMLGSHPALHRGSPPRRGLSRAVGRRGSARPARKRARTCAARRPQCTS